jgi:hypothetical protein
MACRAASKSVVPASPVRLPIADIGSSIPAWFFHVQREQPIKLMSCRIRKFLGSPLVVLGKSLKSICDGLIRHVLRNASQGLRSLLIFLAQHIIPIPTSLNVHVGVASAARSRAGGKSNDAVIC